MRFGPDLLVESPDGGSFALIAVVRLGAISRESVEQLKRYMFGMRCPVALLVTSASVEILRDTYAEFTPAAIESVGCYDAPAEVTAAAAPARAMMFERAVQDWIEGLRGTSRRAGLAPDLKAAVEEHVVPLLYKREVSAARPRELLVSTG